MWTTLGANIADIQASDQRIAVKDTSGNILAKDELGDLWSVESSSADEYAITPNMLAIRQGGSIFIKAGLDDMWTTVTNNAVDMEVAGNRIAFQDSNGAVWAQDGVSGSPQLETTGAAEIDVTNSLLLVRQGDTVLAKAGLGDQWTTLASGITHVDASGNRIAVVDPAGELYAKDGINGGWYLEATNFDQYAITPSLLLIRQGGSVVGKAALADMWTDLGSNITDVKAGDNRVIVRSSAGIIAKEGLNGTWQTETSGADQFLIADTE